MSILSNVVLFLAILVAIIFSLLVLLTGKGDAMSGGGSVRTSYKGKATFDDIMSRAALYLGVSFMGLVLLYNVISGRVRNAEAMGAMTAPVSQPITPPAGNNSPAVTTPAASNNVPAAANNAPSDASNTPPANPKNPSASATNTPAASTPATNAPASTAPAGNNAPK